ncbi:MAG: 50S ribosomal protein L14e [Candidatus Woesearchaeota archaeon]
MFEIGRVCLKLAGRDGNNVCAIVDVIDDSYVVVEGNVRRKKVNVAHLEPLEKTIDITKDASRDDVLKALEGAGFVAKKQGESRKPKPQEKKRTNVKKTTNEQKTEA